MNEENFLEEIKRIAEKDEPIAVKIMAIRMVCNAFGMKKGKEEQSVARSLIGNELLLDEGVLF